jgi:hypothetical protein
MNKVSIHEVSAILITREKEYPERVLKHVESFGFGEILIQTECDGIHWRFAKEPKYKDVYVQDDDCIPQIDKLFEKYDGDLLTCGMTPHHIAFYSKSKICLIGHGAFFPWKRIGVIANFRSKYGMDNDYLIETDRIFTYLNFPQKRVELSVIELPSSIANDRLCMRKGHWTKLKQIEMKLDKFYCFSLSNHNIIFNIAIYLACIFSRVFKKGSYFNILAYIKKSNNEGH